MSNSLPKSSGGMSVSQSCSQDIIKQHSSQGLKRLLQSFLFFILFYLYLWLYVDLRLMYHGAGIITNFPVFYKGWTFFILPNLLLCIYTRYAYHFATTMALLITLLIACLYLKMTLSRTTTLSLLSTFLSLSVISYCLAGGALF